jgi:hypothetical protein
MVRSAISVQHSCKIPHKYLTIRHKISQTSVKAGGKQSLPRPPDTSVSQDVQLLAFGIPGVYNYVHKYRKACVVDFCHNPCSSNTDFLKIPLSRVADFPYKKCCQTPKRLVGTSQQPDQRYFKKSNINDFKYTVTNFIDLVCL